MVKHDADGANSLKALRDLKGNEILVKTPDPGKLHAPKDESRK